MSAMDLLVDHRGFAVWGARRMRCAIGRAGARADKHEGDGATPVGTFVMRQVLYRPDREARPESALPCAAIEPGDGWCDAPADPAYNQPVLLPFRASAESLWREDRAYDLIVILGHNDEPVVPGQGSAIFLHAASADFASTAGCVALAREDLFAVICTADLGSRVIVAA
jgi:L,D-peptidoglycan transpeptidase YkuD (ErfK/YbiS/YcfS/YnhG family)